jgi:hypothetical protein
MDITITFTATAYASDGTASPTVTESITIPRNTGGGGS